MKLLEGFGGYISQNKDAHSEGGEEMLYVRRTRVSVPEDSNVLVSLIFHPRTSREEN